ncbi:MAG: hypothetical protein JSS20_06885, partial [Proteobacteria bacterium]|nr:hypothetical protein [Pseudomonadota bacterium]
MPIAARISTRVLSAVTLAATLTATAGAAELIGTHGDWKVWRHGQGAERMCFAVSAPTNSPTQGSRARPHAFVTYWPEQGGKPEVSVLMGFPLKAGAEVTVEIGDETFRLAADGDRVYARGPREDGRMIDAMQQGHEMTVRSDANAGAQARDT